MGASVAQPTLTRRLYLLSGGLTLAGSLVVLASLAIAGTGDSIFLVNVLVVVFVCVFGLRKVYERGDFERDHSLAYRAVNLGMAVATVVAGLVMLALGLLAYQWFVVGT